MNRPAPQSDELSRSLGLFGATMVGVSAMLGAGVFVLSGVALKQAGPAALVAFALNGLITLVTAFSFAELAAAFPESGGSYVFARKVFPVGGAFATGWVLWLAYLVAAALYALGFGSFLIYAIQVGAQAAGNPLSFPSWAPVAVALVATGLNTGLLTRGGAGAASGIALAKVIAFLLIVVPGLYLVATSEPGTVSQGLVPFAPKGMAGIAVAMGFTFIALEGFEVVAAVGGEVREPAKTIPRAMFLSIGITLTIYLLLLFVMLCIGGPEVGSAWEDLGGKGDQAVAVAVQRYLGPFGTFVVLAAGILATFSALTSALMAASHTSHSMARDRALFRGLARKSLRGTPATAVVVSSLLVALLVTATGDVEIAGVTASLIFLLSFALANGAGLLVRVRAGNLGGFQAPFYPGLPLIGVTACLALAVFQTTLAWQAPIVAMVWLGLGLVLYQTRFRASAQRVSARAEALDTMLVQLRGRTPLILVPLANPDRADTLMTLANGLAPRRAGRVLALAVASHQGELPDAEEGLVAYERCQEALRKAVVASCRAQRTFEAVVMLAADVAKTISKVAAERQPEVVLVGMSRLDAESGGSRLIERLVVRSNADLVVVEAPPSWGPSGLKKILVPIGGRTSHDPLRARLLGVLTRESEHEVEVQFLRVVRDEAEQPRALMQLHDLAQDLGRSPEDCRVQVSQDAGGAIIAAAESADLIVMGLTAQAGKPLIGPFVERLAGEASCPLIAIAHPE